jgi:hypothetical protein
MIVHCLFCIRYEFKKKKVVGACLEVVFKFEQRATYFGSFVGGGRGSANSF